jgi:uncharacterized membrane protein (DUF485 family)
MGQYLLLVPPNHYRECGAISDDSVVNENSFVHGEVGDEGVGPGGREVLRRIMRRQAALSVRVAAVFILLLIALPLANLYLPDAMGTKISGFTLTWLILAVLFYPITWLLSGYFVRKSEEVEAELTKELAADPNLRIAKEEGR